MPTSAVFPGFEPATAARREETVLLVEDEEALAELLTHLLKRFNIRVLHAFDGAGALEILTQHGASITLAFVDCHLPDMGGDELCRELRARLPGLPLLLTSGRDRRAWEQLFAGGGPCSFLPKPYMPGEVIRRVTALLPAAG